MADSALGTYLHGAINKSNKKKSTSWLEITFWLEVKRVHLFSINSVYKTANWAQQIINPNALKKNDV